jgi:hypothetical protein
METTTNIRKEKLLEIIRGNRDKHREVFEAALAGYRDTALAQLEEKIASLESGRTPEIRVVVPRPEDHTVDYDRIIRMLELDTGETFTLSERMFAHYVMDDWDWKRQFVKMSSRYAAASTREAYGDFYDEDM